MHRGRGNPPSQEEEQQIEEKGELLLLEMRRMLLERGKDENPQPDTKDASNLENRTTFCN